MDAIIITLLVFLLLETHIALGLTIYLFLTRPKQMPIVQTEESEVEEVRAYPENSYKEYEQLFKRIN